MAEADNASCKGDRRAAADRTRPAAPGDWKHAGFCVHAASAPILTSAKISSGIGIAGIELVELPRDVFGALLSSHNRVPPRSRPSPSIWFFEEENAEEGRGRWEVFILSPPRRRPTPGYFHRFCGGGRFRRTRPHRRSRAGRPRPGRSRLRRGFPGVPGGSRGASHR